MGPNYLFVVWQRDEEYFMAKQKEEVERWQKLRLGMAAEEIVEWERQKHLDMVHDRRKSQHVISTAAAFNYHREDNIRAGTPRSSRGRRRSLGVQKLPNSQTSSDADGQER